MSALASTLSAALSGTSYITVPAAGLVAISSAPDSMLPEGLKAAAFILGGLAFLATVVKNLTVLAAAARGMMGMPAPNAAHTEPLVTRKELDERLDRIEKRLDRSNRDHRRELTDLTKTMNLALRDMTEAVARLEGAVNPDAV